MSFTMQGIIINLSFFQVSDIIALLLVLIITSFNIVPESKVKNKWARAGILIGGSLIILVVQHFLIRDLPPLSNRLPTDLEVRWYGVLIMLGALAAVLVSAWGAKRKGINPNTAWDMLPWLLIAGIIGARLWHVFTPGTALLQEWYQTGLTAYPTQNYYFVNPIAMLEIWKGGLGIPGAIMGGALACWIYCRIKKQEFVEWMDIVAPGLAIAQAIGRWGNYFNQELFGVQTKFFLGISINGSVEKYHPLFLYESVWNLLNFGLLILLSYKAAKKLLKGDLFLIYVAFYAFGRFWLEFIRVDSIKFNQYFMVVLFVLSLGYLVFKHLYKRNKIVEEKVAVKSVKTGVKKTLTKAEKSPKKEAVKTKAVVKEFLKKPKK